MTRAGAQSQGSAGHTTDELLSIAERLFAERGVENVPLTSIVALSKQKNRSAVHYHFGSRNGVLTAVLNRRLVSINARREAVLDALPPAPSLQLILWSATWALTEAVVDEAWGADYVAVLAQVISHPQVLGGEAVDNALMTGARHTRRLVSLALPQLPAEILGRRLAWWNETVVSSLARWVRDTPAAGRSPQAAETLVNHLVAYGAAGLAAPAPAN